MSNDINQRSPEEKRQWFLNEIENNSHYNEALKGADLSNIDLSNIDFSSLNISSTLSFENSCLKGVNFSQSILDQINFYGANLENANFHQTIFKNVKFVTNSNLKVYLVGAIFTEANFMNKVNFYQCSLCAANFSQAIFNDKAYFNSANLSNSHFKETIFNKRVEFNYAQLINTDFTRAKFKWDSIDFLNANLENVNFSRVNPFILGTARFERTNFNNVVMPNQYQSLNFLLEFIYLAIQILLLIVIIVASIVTGYFLLRILQSSTINIVFIIIPIVLFLLGIISLSIAFDPQAQIKLNLFANVFLGSGIILIGTGVILLLIVLLIGLIQNLI